MAEIDTGAIALILELNKMGIGNNPSFAEADGRGGFITGAECTGQRRCDVVKQIAAYYLRNKVVFGVPWADDQEARRKLCVSGGEFGCSRCEVGKSGWVLR